MIRILFIILTLNIPQALLAQEVFQRSYGGYGSDYGRAVIECSDGGYLVAGSTNSFQNESTDVYLLRVDESGDYLWGQNIGLPDHIEWGVDLVEDADGNFIIAGYTNATPQGTYDGLLIKTDHSGNVIWQKTFGGDDWDFFESMALTTAGNVVLAGQKTVDGNTEGWIIMTNPDGSVLWETLFPGNGIVKLTGVDICPSGVIVFTGYIENSLLETKTQISGSLNLNGEIVWASTFPQLGQINSENCKCSGENNILAIGTDLNDVESHLFLISLNSDFGTVNWSRSLTNPGDGLGLGISENSDSHIILAGALSGIISPEYSATSFEFDENGQDISEQFSVLQGSTGEDIFYDITPLEDGGYICTGHSTSFGNNYQILLSKIGPNGERDLSNTDYLDTTTKLTSTGKPTQFNIYPNPANDKISIALEIKNVAYYSIHDLRGKTLSEGKIHSNKPAIDVSRLKNGLYFIQIETAHRGVFSSRFVKMD